MHRRPRTFTGVVESYKVVDGAWIAFAIKQTQGSQPIELKLSSLCSRNIPATRFSPLAAIASHAAAGPLR